MDQDVRVSISSTKLTGDRRVRIMTAAIFCTEAR